MRLVSLFILLVLAACSADDTGTATRGVSDDTITLGSHTDLSGGVAIWGVPTTNGMRVRFDELSAAGGVHGRTIELIVEDSQYQVPLAVRATNKLINVDNVFAMIGAMGTPQNNALFDRMFEANVPSLFPLTGAVSMYEPLHPMKFGYFVSYRDQVRGAIAYFVEEEGIHRVCVQNLATDYGEEVAIGFHAAVEEHGLEVTYAGSHRATETDFTGTVTSIKNSNCELLVVGPLIRDAIQLYTAARDAGFDAPIVGNMVPYVPEIAAVADNRTEGFYSAAPFLLPDFLAEVEAGSWVGQWYSNYIDRFGEPPVAQSMIGYVIADLTVIALQSAGRDLTVEKLLTGIEGIDYYESPFGGPSLSFSAEKHQGGDALNLYQVQDGNWQIVAEGLSY